MAVKEKIRIRIKGYDHQLVDQSAEKIVETARRTGFSSPQYFSAVFRRYTGTAPSRYHRGVELPII